MGIKVTGSKSLDRKFDRLGTVGKGRTLERALVAGGLPVQNEGKRLAPKLSGNLARSIHIGGHEDLNPGGQGAINTTGAGVPNPEIGADRAAIYIGTDVVYAPPHEFGTEHMPAQPFMRPAFETQRKTAVKETGLALRDLIQAAI